MRLASSLRSSTGSSSAPTRGARGLGPADDVGKLASRHVRVRVAVVDETAVAHRAAQAGRRSEIVLVSPSGATTCLGEDGANPPVATLGG